MLDPFGFHTTYVPFYSKKTILAGYSFRLMAMFSNIINSDLYTYILYFIFGGLFILFTYHLLRFAVNGITAYLFYSLHAFFSFLAYINVVEAGFIHTFSEKLGFNTFTKEYFTTIYNVLYALCIMN